MSDETYVDPNSGAAPQPGGFAGVEAAEKGFNIPAGVEVENELSPAEYEAPGASRGVDYPALQDGYEAPEKSEAGQRLAEALSNPKQVLADLDEGDSASSVEVPEAGDDEDAADDAAVEHEAVDPSGHVSEGEDEDDSDEEEAESDAEGDDESGAEEEAEAETFDPAEHDVDEVLAYIAEHPDQKDAVLAAEQAGKNRKSVK